MNSELLEDISGQVIGSSKKALGWSLMIGGLAGMFYAPGWLSILWIKMIYIGHKFHPTLFSPHKDPT